MNKVITWGTEKTAEALSVWSRYKLHPISLKDFIAFGKNPKTTAALSCHFLVRELPTRLAHMTKEIDRLPPILFSTPSVQIVRTWYTRSFQEIVTLGQESTTLSENQFVNQFCETIKGVLTRHQNVVPTMAQGILEYRSALEAQNIPRPIGAIGPIDPSIRFFLDRFYLSRIGIRMLMSQHLELFDVKGSSIPPNGEGWIGVIQEDCKVVDIIDDAASNASFLCDQYYGLAPEVETITSMKRPITFSYVPSHIYHIIFELLKNSMRAVVEHHKDSDYLPKVKVIVAKGDEDITIKISDEGSGIPRSGLPQLFSYMYTTAQLPKSGMQTNAPLAGYGFGLPLSRLYAKYFGGDLKLISMEGYGTDAYVHLKLAHAGAEEVIPYLDQNGDSWQSEQ